MPALCDCQTERRELGALNYERTAQPAYVNLTYARNSTSLCHRRMLPAAYEADSCQVGHAFGIRP